LDELRWRPWRLCRALVVSLAGAPLDDRSRSSRARSGPEARRAPPATNCRGTHAAAGGAGTDAQDPTPTPAHRALARRRAAAPRPAPPNGAPTTTARLRSLHVSSVAGAIAHRSSAAWLCPSAATAWRGIARLPTARRSRRPTARNARRARSRAHQEAGRGAQYRDRSSQRWRAGRGAPGAGARSRRDDQSIGGCPRGHGSQHACAASHKNPDGCAAA